MRLAFIGFGEAAQAMALGFRDDGGLERLAACDVRLADPAAAADLRARAADLGVVLSATAAEAVEGADVVLSLVPGSAAVAVATTVAPVLRAGQTFVDLNSVSPDLKRTVADAIEAGGPGAAVEGAIMDAVRPRRQKVPILLAGPSAAAVAARLNEAGMRCEAIGEEIGQACAVKMIRSVMIKGVEALILESMRAAEVAGVTERILSSVDGTFPGLDWRRLTSHYLKRTHEHGPRRVSEMKEAAATLESLGVAPVMARAIAATLADGVAGFSGAPYDPSAEYPAMLARLAEAARNRKDAS